MTCKSLCDTYFSDLGYDEVEQKFRAYADETPGCAEEESCRAMRNHDIALQGYCDQNDGTRKCDMSPYQICRNNCGPVYHFADGEESVAPYVSSPSIRQRPVHERHNHWHFVNFIRGWDGNDNLDNWLRSYTVNRDKPSAPSKVCNDVVRAYCKKLYPTNSGNAQQRKECRKGLLAAAIDFDGDGQGDSNAFCDHFYQGNMLCENTCYTCGADCFQNSNHICGQGFIGQEGDKCDPHLAVCVSSN
jgi:hypothetical protein